MKELSEKELDRALEDISFKAARKSIPLDKHQKVCIVLGVAHKCFAFWLDMGTGKTRIALELIRYWMKAGDIKGALVLAPSESVVIGWENQIKEWKIKLPFVTLLNSSSQSKWDILSEFEGGLILATYPGLIAMLTTLKDVKNKKKRKRTISRTLIKRLCKIVGALVLDEATKGANKGSLNYRVCNQISKYAPIRYELAGRPFGRDPTALWSQLYLIDRGETLGDTLGMFRAAFFKDKPNFFGGTEYKFKKELQPKLNRILRHRSITYSGKECGIKHKVRHSLEEVTLPGEAQAYYERFVKDLKKSHAGFIEKQNSFIRMRQVSSGFVGVINDSTGEKAEIAFAVNPKLDRLMELVEEVPKGCKFVIFHEFNFSGRLICEALHKRKIEHGWIHGGIKNMRELQQRYDHDDKFHGFVANHKMTAFGGNWQRGNYAFVYESPVPAIDDEQMRKRLPRKGQTRTVFEYDLVCKGTVDSRILAFHREGANAFKAVIRDPSTLDK